MASMPAIFVDSMEIIRARSGYRADYLSLCSGGNIQPHHSGNAGPGSLGTAESGHGRHRDMVGY